MIWIRQRLAQVDAQFHTFGLQRLVRVHYRTLFSVMCNVLGIGKS
jgi:hypothetical protein